ncbi:MAG: hypothetical protein HZC41_08745 [Chloroflexi bacterium]|nr:hypothetical protein [Chloroflexota bacterium]
MSVDERDIQALADNCIAENARYQREGHSDPAPCFELLRLALADSHPLALEHIYAIYKPRLERWASLHPLFADSDEDAEFFADWAFTNFINASTGDNFRRKFTSLPAAIRYMRVCTHNTISGYMRKPPPALLPEDLDPPDPTPLDTDLLNDQLWAHICQRLPDPTHQLLARLVFVLDMKPREIVQEYSHIWQREREVSVMLYRIRLTLRGDDELKHWFDSPAPHA